MKQKLLLTALLLHLLGAARAQSTNIPLNADAEQTLLRLSLLEGGAFDVHPEIRPWERKQTVEIANRLNNGSKFDRRDARDLLDDSNEFVPDSIQTNAKSLLRYFYRTPGHLFEVNSPHFYLKADPMLHVGLGFDPVSNKRTFLNRRGIEVRGGVDDRVYFYTSVVESQWKAPDYIEQWVNRYQAVPGAGFYKTYDSSIFKVENGYDFNIATAYVGVKASEHIGVQLGHGQNFIGNGYRSLLLSDVGANYFYLRLNTRVWRLHYQNLFMELSPVSQRQVAGNALLPKKYAAIHYLHYNITPRIGVGFFEATVFNRKQQFELQYLNPVILYRTVEGFIGSPDNVLIGADLRVDLANSIRLYGQVLIDEFRFSDVFKPDQKGWWGNKFGLQAGLHYINVLGIDHLDLQLEFNAVRPFTYSHFDSLSSYTHYNQALAHPLWSNLNEGIAILRYQPLQHLRLQMRYIRTSLGENDALDNWGADPLLSYNSRVMEYGNEIGQGTAANIQNISVDVSWEFYRRMYLDVQLLYRDKNSTDDTRDLTTSLFNAGVRINMWRGRTEL
ncbi:MAG: hypothetical protein IPL65_18065 [Lewinellaceae bacterium]|nr:hypothetical protein [Lewinellaceae bacterium]